MRTDYTYRPAKPAAPASPPSPPSHKVASDFAAFSAPSASVFGAAVSSSPFAVAGSKAAFSGMRGGRSTADMDEDDDADDGNDDEPGIGFREDSITLEQVRRGADAGIASPLTGFRRNASHCRARGEARVASETRGTRCRVCFLCLARCWCFLRPCVSSHV